jgi:ABC-type Mn2+/Zn2+ transport system ATPase subunit
MKKVIIIAGPNGAGKTTFARNFLPKEAQTYGSTQLTGDGHLSNTVEYTIPTTVRQYA